MRGNFASLLSRLLCTAAAGVAAPVFAQGTAVINAPAASAPAEEKAAIGVADIVVTARKRAENLQDVPIAVTALGSVAMERAHITSVLDVAALTPGVTMTQFNIGEPQTYIRGVGSQTDSAASESSVTISMDEVAIGRGGATSIAFLDANRVEVLRGPQGTLYGRNASAGTISFYSNRPTDRFEGSVEASAGSFRTFGGKGIVNLPVGDGMAFRAAGQYSDSRGYAYNLLTGKHLQGGERYGGRLQFQAEKDAWTVLLTGDYSKDNLDGDSRSIVSTYLASPTFARLAAASNADRKNVWESETIPGTFQRRRNYGLVGRVEYAADWATLTSLTAYRNNLYSLRADYVGETNFPFQTDDRVNEASHQFSQELRLTSPSSSKIQWVAGLFYYSDSIDRQERFVVTAVAPLPTALGGDNTALQNASTKSYAAFGQVTIPFASIFELTLGARISRDKKEVFQQAVHNAPAGQGLGFPFFPGSLYAVPASASFTKPTWRATLAMEPSPDKHFYLSYDRGYKSGTFTSQAQNATQATFLVKPEQLDSFNLGAKTQWLDNTLRVNADLFYLDYKKLQVFEFGANLNFILANANARIKGAEIQVVIAPSRNLNVGMNASLLDGKFTSNPQFAGATLAYKGNRLSRAPRYKVSNYVELSEDMFGGRGLVRLSQAFQSDFFYNPSNDVAGLQKAYSVLNGFASWESESGLKLSLSADNLTNEQYSVHHISFQNLGVRIFAPPRSYTFTVSQRF
ncbi:TonB-dependent receptor [Sphingobium chlorophenolicum L-1]|uniref:TonB-dependent receptor n=1 Tax=Sphingobium chlorophenolicum L-1 TaxID=690566 RepID=F6EVY8_SPHCR|nr:TonB-dependent receptor [Sphingobium chlorophenolicum L-1]